MLDVGYTVFHKLATWTPTSSCISHHQLAPAVSTYAPQTRLTIELSQPVLFALGVAGTLRHLASARTSHVCRDADPWLARGRARRLTPLVVPAMHSFLESFSLRSRPHAALDHFRDVVDCAAKLAALRVRTHTRSSCVVHLYARNQSPSAGEAEVGAKWAPTPGSRT